MINDFEDRIIITDEDIDNLEKSWGDVTFDITRREIIKDLSSFDVQAFPGTGKTTVLIAKLAILAEKWPYATKGICVLSHTNVAREEIEIRLGKTEYGRKLLSYPHFIGTIHSFMNCFVALPWMKSNGYHTNVIDTEITLKQRFANLNVKTKTYFQNKRLNEYSCESINFPIELNLKCSSEANSYKNVYNIVKTSYENGFFTFNELLYFAQYALIENKDLSRIIKNRFPIMFVDEAQDTDELQAQLIDLAFGKDNSVIKQKFGDGNQAIYSSTESTGSANFFPNEPLKTIGNSMRFTNTIAKLSDRFSVYAHDMVGENEAFIKNDSKHTIFLFGKNKIEDVVTAYGELVLECFTDKELHTNSKYGVHIIGMVHNKKPISKDDAHFPQSISDYNKSYSGKLSGKSYTPKSMIEYYRMANMNDSNEVDAHVKISLVADGLRRYINASTLSDIHSTTNIFKSIINAVSPDKQTAFRKDFKRILDLPFHNQAEWETSVQIIKEMVGKYFTVISEFSKFMKWSAAEIPAVENKTNTINVIEYENEEGRKVPIKFGSIHSVKGRTHLSTLVVETYWNDYNLKSIIKLICGKIPNSIPVRNNKRMKIHYVGLTRAKGLICLALPIESVSDEQKTILKSFGWNIKEIL